MSGTDAEWQGGRVRAVVTGLGPISAVGCDRAAFWQSLVSGQHGFGPITLCDASGSPSKIAAEVKGFNLADYVDNGRTLGRRLPRGISLGLAAAARALTDAGLDPAMCDSERIGINVGTSIGNLSSVFELVRRFTPTSRRHLPGRSAFHVFNHAAACVLSSVLDIRGPSHTTSTGCNSGLDALGHALRLIQAGVVDAMLVVGTDCEVVTEVIACLNASGSLATRYNDDPGRASRPFDVDRDGNVIGEGAAAVLLESEVHARARGARIYAEMTSHAVCSAGQHREYSHDHPETDLGPCVRAFRAALAESRWSPTDVDVVSANGSSSRIYDRVEGLALGEVFGDALPDVRIHSIKSMLGQHGAGSSMLQVAAACLTLFCGTIPPTINHDQPDPECGPLRVVTHADPCTPTRAMVHAIGLGGFYYSVGAFQTM